LLDLRGMGQCGIWRGSCKGCTFAEDIM